MQAQRSLWCVATNRGTAWTERNRVNRAGRIVGIGSDQRIAHQLDRLLHYQQSLVARPMSPLVALSNHPFASRYSRGALSALPFRGFARRK
jgi:hypothetical protein